MQQGLSMFLCPAHIVSVGSLGRSLELQRAMSDVVKRIILSLKF